MVSIISNQLCPMYNKTWFKDSPCCFPVKAPTDSEFASYTRILLVLAICRQSWIGLTIPSLFIILVNISALLYIP